MRYQDFIKQKTIVFNGKGIEGFKISNQLFDFQKAIVNWSLRKGRSAIFADCGLGKTPMQLEWAKHICNETEGNVLILAPLAVSKQTKREGDKFGIEVTICRSQEDVKPGINITNYEMLDHFVASEFQGVVLDESSILKSYSGKIRNQIITSFEKAPFRLACTATPAPNDYMELGNHAEFLGVMKRTEMLSTYFIHDGGDTAKWRLKGHAQEKFWQWMASWCVVLKKPSDIGFDDTRFKLNKLTVKEHIVEGVVTEGYLIPMVAHTLEERRKARKSSINDRVNKCVELIRDSKDQWLIWCDFNAESEMLKQGIEGSVEVKGADTSEHKETSAIDFASGKIKYLVSKPSMFGFGLNFQNCHNMVFVGLSDSYEQFYQAVRRCWRFGQKKEVTAHVIISDAEHSILKNIKHKERIADDMAKSMVLHMKDLSDLTATKKTESNYQTDVKTGEKWTLYLGDCVDEIKKIKDDSIHYSIFSPPFGSLYTYSNSERDMGNSKNDDEFYTHFRFLVKELYRVIMPGRLLSFHCMNLPTSKERDGVIGIRDFRGELIKMFCGEGFVYHSEVCIWKDPVIAMQRTKALGLLHKQIKKDSCMSRQGIPDYLVTMRKPGDNPERVTHTNETFPVALWQQYASPIWMDINPSNTLQKESARENNDERHICPLQLQVIQRAMELWTNPNDIILSPFAGIGSEGWVAIEMGRRFIGIELKKSYWSCACNNLEKKQNEMKSGLLI